MTKAGALLFWLGAVGWVGGLAALALLAAPVIFRTAPSRESAGLIFGALLRTFSRVEIACALMVAASFLLTWPRPAPVHAWMRLGLFIAMVSALVVIQAWLIPSMESLRGEMAASEAAHLKFQRFHKLSEKLYGVILLSGVALVALTAWYRSFGPSEPPPA